MFPEIEDNNNRIKNQRYTVNSFFPKVLYNYFKHFQNLIIVVIVVVQMFPVFRVSYEHYSFIIPLGVILTILFMKEHTDDMKKRENAS